LVIDLDLLGLKPCPTGRFVARLALLIEAGLPAGKHYGYFNRFSEKNQEKFNH
jgi:hypothetical protein